MKTIIAAALASLFGALANAAQPSDAAPLIVEDLRCRGNVTNSCDFLLGQIYLDPGDLVDEEEIQNAELRLIWMPSVESADIYLERGSEKGKVIVVVEVTEGDAIASELAIGTTWRVDSFNQTIAGRLTRSNLFGAGKVIDFTARALVPLGGPTRQLYQASLAYTDPHFLGAKRVFASAGVFASSSHFEVEHGDFGESEFVGASVHFGVRLFDFSYLTGGYAYRPVAEHDFRITQRGGIVESGHGAVHSVWVGTYGWNSEDDPYFPTQGSRLQGIIAKGPGTRDDYSLNFRKTWAMQGSFLSLRLGETPGGQYGSTFDEDMEVSIGLSRPVHMGERFGGMSRGRWYVEAGVSRWAWSPRGEKISEVGLKAGLRLDTKSLGVVDFYLIGTGEVRTGGDP